MEAVLAQEVISYSVARCCYCDNSFTGGRRSTIEHLVPRSKGGNNRDINKQKCCNLCNSWRNSKGLIYWAQEIIELLNEHRTKIPYTRTELEIILKNIYSINAFVEKNIDALKAKTSKPSTKTKGYEKPCAGVEDVTPKDTWIERPIYIDCNGSRSRFNKYFKEASIVHPYCTIDKDAFWYIDEYNRMKIITL